VDDQEIFVCILLQIFLLLGMLGLESSLRDKTCEVCVSIKICYKDDVACMNKR
jgi:hypothetical protein